LIQKPGWKRNDALAGDRRRANEEANLPLAGNYDRLGLGRGSSQLHNDDDCGSGCDGRDRVHGDAELAMIGVALAGVKVRDLSNSERSQEDEAQDCDGRQKAGPDAISGAAFAAENCLRSCQWLKPSSPILQNFHMDLDAMGLERLYLGHDFAAAREKTPSGRERLN
jgi:hypothetical protein